MKTALQPFAVKDVGINSPEKLRTAGRRVIYRPENGPGVTAKHFMKLCKNDEKIAFRLFSLCEWQCPETLLDEDRNEQDPRNVCFTELLPDMKHTKPAAKPSENPARAAFWAKVRKHSKPIDWDAIAPARPARLTGAAVK